MKKSILIFAQSLISILLFAQATSSPNVIASTANYYGTPGSLEVSYTVGEMTAITTAGNVSGVHVTQGFHQPEELVILGLNDQQETPLIFYVYPNPTADILWLGYEMTQSGTAIINLTDLTGKTIETFNKHNYTSGQNIEHFDVSKLSSGNYLLTLQFTTGTGKPFSSSKQFSVTR